MTNKPLSEDCKKCGKSLEGIWVHGCSKKINDWQNKAHDLAVKELEKNTSEDLHTQTSWEKEFEKKWCPEKGVGLLSPFCHLDDVRKVVDNQISKAEARAYLQGERNQKLKK